MRMVMTLKHKHFIYSKYSWLHYSYRAIYDVNQYKRMIPIIEVCADYHLLATDSNVLAYLY